MLAFSLASSLTGDLFDGDAGGHDAPGHVDHDVFTVLSLRNATYFLFAFGAAGVVLSWLFEGRGFVFTVITAAVALALGLVGGLLSGLVFGWLRKNDSGGVIDDQAWGGLSAQVTLPLSAQGTGKILVARGGREHELLARPFDGDAGDPKGWKDVVVVELREGIALVSPLDTPESTATQE
jgi:hypothetical protein